MPEASRRGLAQLGLRGDDTALMEKARWGGLLPGTRVKKGDPLFPRKQ
jgi:hypothetical protein